MKKLTILFAVAILTFACKSTSATSLSVDNKSEVAMKGDWTLTKVSYPGSEYIKVISFQLADSKCFEGSTWHFISNNNKGSMVLNQPNCTSFSSPIKWYVNKNGEFVLKVLDAGEKAKKVRDGYILTVANQSENAFQLVDKVDVAGKIASVVYQFQKN
ncbi:MAG: lipocalin family protein [Flavobacterium sp.]|nr:lipocalin family protein [Flavobacterium sp.]